MFNTFADEDLQKGVILCPTNAEVRKINATIIQRLKDRHEMIYLSRTKLIDEDKSVTGSLLLTTTQEELDAVSAPNIPPHRLHLKVGVVVSLLINLDQRQNLCNGTRFIVEELYQNVIKLKRLHEFQNKRSSVFLPRMLMKSDDIPVCGTIERYQFPVTLACAMTINKAQGQTVEKLGIYLRKPVFAHGQLYVAISRARRMRDVSVCVVPGPGQGPPRGMRGGKSSNHTISTKNIVYRQVLAS